MKVSLFGRPRTGGRSAGRSTSSAHVDIGRAHALDPSRRQDLLVFPLAAAQPEIADLRHVARLQRGRSRPSNALRVGKPLHVVNAQRSQQPLPRIVERALARDLRHDGRQELAGCCCCSRSACPAASPSAGRGRIAASRGSPRIMPIYGVEVAVHALRPAEAPRSCRAGGGPAIAFLASSRLAMVRLGQALSILLASVLPRRPSPTADADQGADDGLGRRVGSVLQPGLERCIGRLQHDAAVARHQHAVHVVQGAEVDQAREAARNSCPVPQARRSTSPRVGQGEGVSAGQVAGSAASSVDTVSSPKRCEPTTSWPPFSCDQATVGPRAVQSASAGALVLSHRRPMHPASDSARLAERHGVICGPYIGERRTNRRKQQRRRLRP